MPEIGKDNQSLPLEDPGKSGASTLRGNGQAGWSWWRRFLFAVVLVGVGVASGNYWDPLATRGAPTANLDRARSRDATETGRGDAPSASSEKALDVVALGRLVPNGGVLALALPSGADDARIARLLVSEGDHVSAGQAVAELDNMPSLLAASASAATNVKAQSAALEQVRSSMLASLAESRANLAAAKATLRLANQELDRQTRLSGSSATTEVLIDQARANAAKAQAEVDRAAAMVERYNGAGTGGQPDIMLAKRNLDLARTNLVRANTELASGRVVAPRPGTVLEIHAHAGEKPSEKGVMTVGDLTRMTAELEVYQTEVEKVESGQIASVTSSALPEPLTGKVTRIGWIVGRQSVMSTEPAANVDARIVKVTVTLDAKSSAYARSYTNLEVIGRIRTSDK